MIQEDELQEGLVRLGRAVGSGDSIANEVMRKIRASGVADRSKTSLAIERILQMNRITKLAAAVLIITGIAALMSFFIIGHGGASVAFAEVVEPILSARTATFKITIKAKGHPTRTCDGMFMEPGLMRQTVAGSGGIVITDLQQMKILQLAPAEKTAILLEFEGQPEDMDLARFNMFHEIRRRIEEAQETEDESVEFLGEREIDGVLAIGYRVKTDAGIITVWADSRTKWPVRMETATGSATVLISDIVFDVQLDKSLFSMEVPEGYTLSKHAIKQPQFEDVAVLLRVLARMNDGQFLDALPEEPTMDAYKEHLQGFDRALGAEEAKKVVLSMGRGIMFLEKIYPAGHYAGRGVKLGDSETPIFWYKPKDSQTYWVIYGDLSIKDVPAEDLPEKAD